jgi:hypothetical protein
MGMKIIMTLLMFFRYSFCFKFDLKKNIIYNQKDYLCNLF